MNTKLIVSDFDGVLANSLQLALNILRKIVDLFDKSEKVDTFIDYYRLLGKKSELKNISAIESDTLRELNRIMIRHYSGEVKLFNEVLEIYSKLVRKPMIVSSSYADVINTILGNYQICFDKIYGYEAGHKEDILQNLINKTQFVYVTDTHRDVILCKSIGIPVIATCWGGYDSIEKIKNETPDYLARNFDELNEILLELKFITS